MINKSTFTDQVIDELLKSRSSKKKEKKFHDLIKAANLLHSAIDIFQSTGMTSQAEAVFTILKKIASKEDAATKSLTSEKMVENLKDHGTEFNLLSDSADHKKTEEILDKNILEKKVKLNDIDKKFSDLLSGSDAYDVNALISLDDSYDKKLEKQLSYDMDFEDEI